MADLNDLTTFPGQVDTNTYMTEFCRVEIVGVGFDEEDRDIRIEDIYAPSIFERYQPPAPEDGEEGDVTLCVALTFYTDGGEVCRYIQDSQSDDVYQVFAKVLAMLGQKGWQAIELVIDDEDDEETWYLQRSMRR
jgi:hypothetical protein